MPWFDRSLITTSHLRHGRLGRGLALLALIAAASCGDEGPPPPRPTSINMFPAQAAFDAVGDTRNFVAAVRDQNGLALDDATVTFSSSNPAVVSVDANGRATAESDGSAVIRATAGDAVGEAPVTVAQIPTALEEIAGDGQDAPAGTDLPVPLEVRATDRLGGAVPGLTVEFSVIEGGGSVTPQTAQTDAQGRAMSTWTLGTRAGEPQAARAALVGSGVPGVPFTADAFAGPPAEIDAVAGANQAGVVGTQLPVPLTVRVVDAFDNPLPSQVSFTVISGGGSIAPSAVTTGFDGLASAVWTLGATEGQQVARATSDDLQWDFMATGVSSAGPPAMIDVVSGADQASPIDAPLPDQVSVVVRDAQGVGVSGVDVTFTPDEGSVDPMVATTDASGVARTTWTLGSTIGTQTLQVSTTALGPLTVSAEGRDPGPTCVAGTPDSGAFNITLCYVASVTAPIEQAFENARAVWESLITGDQSDVPPRGDEHTACVSSATAPPIQGAFIDDVVIYVTIEEIDGEFGVLGSAGPCFIRQSNALTTVGSMRFDVADLDRLAAADRLELVILHEMGHVLGIGTLWSTKGFLQNAATAGQTPPGPDTHFDGPLAIAAFNTAGGQNRTAGQKVPVENVGNAGSINGHWRESVMDRELMTPFIDSGVDNPLSIISV
ncbi:MAG: hypothetical protein HKN71_01995, partial [Gemmatimonadetes bacterium]|nr:hypothetical protein [Gemmatimonadota bacterium]